MAATLREACLTGTRLGLRLYAQGRYAEALRAFNGALALDDTICLTWVGKGKSLLELQRIDEAQAAFDHALSLDSTNADALQGKRLADDATHRMRAQSVADDLFAAAPEALDGMAVVARLGFHALHALLHGWLHM